MGCVSFPSTGVLLEALDVGVSRNGQYVPSLTFDQCHGLHLEVPPMPHVLTSGACRRWLDHGCVVLNKGV